MEDSAELNRKMGNVIRPGVIAAVDYARALVRVKSGALLTDWLPWLVHRAGKTRTWDPPTAGEAACVLSASGDPAAGIVLPALYTAQNPPPSSSPDEHLVVYPDGARILYNHATGALSATGIKTALIEASESVTVDCPESVFTGNVTVRGRLTYQGGMTGSNNGAAAATITGAVTQTGGALSSNGIVLSTHTHPGTGGPQ